MSDESSRRRGLIGENGAGAQHCGGVDQGGSRKSEWIGVGETRVSKKPRGSRAEQGPAGRGQGLEAMESAPVSRARAANVL